MRRTNWKTVCRGMAVVALLLHLVFPLPNQVMANRDGIGMPEVCRDASNEKLLEMISRLPLLPEVRDADLEPIICLGERQDEYEEIFSGLRRLYYQMEKHSDRCPTLEAIDESMIELDQEEAVEFLWRDIDHDDWCYRYAAIVTLGKMDDDDEILEYIAGRMFDLGAHIYVEEVFLVKTYGQTREYILEMLKYPKNTSESMAVKILESYFKNGAISLSAEDDELFESLREISADRSNHYSEWLKIRVERLIDDLMTLPGSADLE